MPRMTTISQHSTAPARLYRTIERGFDACFGGGANPLKHLGALAFALFWLLVVTGAVLYAVLDTSAGGAYRSIHVLSRDPYSAGSILRGLHRYAADGFILVTLAHLVREWMLGRFAAFRRYSWLTGVPLPVLAFVCAIGGFWLNWDRLGQYSAVATTEWLDALPFISAPLARNFLSGAFVADRLFSLLVFVHLGVPLLLLYGLWFHLQRVARADVFPPRTLTIGTALALFALALALPVRSQGPADLAIVPTTLTLDWLLLFVHPLVESTSAQAVWLGLAALLALLFGLPFLRPRAAQPAARVDPDHCNGCQRCVADCPYAAITMVPHPSGRHGLQLAQVRAPLCASCGICVGSCPSSTPFRRGATLDTGIDMPQWPIDHLRRKLQDGLQRAQGERRFVVFGCDRGVGTQALLAPDVLAYGLPCIGMLPPAFIEYALRNGADGVLVAGCREGGCEFRLGQEWTAQRFAGEREPHVRASVPAQRVRTAWADAGDEGALHEALWRLREQDMVEVSE